MSAPASAVLQLPQKKKKPQLTLQPTQRNNPQQSLLTSLNSQPLPHPHPHPWRLSDSLFPEVKLSQTILSNDSFGGGVGVGGLSLGASLRDEGGAAALASSSSNPLNSLWPAPFNGSETLKPRVLSFPQLGDDDEEEGKGVGQNPFGEDSSSSDSDDSPPVSPVSGPPTSSARSRPVDPVAVVPTSHEPTSTSSPPEDEVPHGEGPSTPLLGSALEANNPATPTLATPPQGTPPPPPFIPGSPHTPPNRNSALAQPPSIKKERLEKARERRQALQQQRQHPRAHAVRLNFDEL